MGTLRGASAVSVLAALLAGSSIEAQQIRGRVIVQGTDTPVPEAHVTLLDAGLREVAAVRTNRDGEFRFTRIEPGTYQVQAGQGGVRGPLSSAIAIGARMDTSVVVEMPSPWLILAMTCAPATRAEVTAVIVGTVHDRNSGIGLPGARVLLTWEGGRIDAIADKAGSFRLCGAPVGRPLSLLAQSLGRSAESEIQLDPTPVSRVDIGIELGAVQFALAVTGRSPTTNSTSVLTIRLRDAASGRPLSGAAVWLGHSKLAAFSSNDGYVRIDGVAPGVHDIRVEMVGYGSRTAAIDVPSREDLRIDVRVPAVPIVLEPIAVQSHMRSEFRTPREASTRVDIIAGANMAAAEDRGAQVVDLLRGSFPGLFVHEGFYSTLDQPNLAPILCVESNRRLDRLRLPDGVQEPFCDMVTVVFDGVPTFDAGQLLRNMSVRELESVEFLGPLEAGLRYGNRASQAGALVLWSKGQGPHKSSARHKV